MKLISKGLNGNDIHSGVIKVSSQNQIKLWFLNIQIIKREIKYFLTTYNINFSTSFP